MPKVKRRTGERITTAKTQAIVNGLAAGEPIEKIAKRTHSSNHTVMAIRETNAQEVASRKQMLVAGFGRLAANGVDRLNEQMEAGKLTGALLMTTTGMATDKLALLSNDPQQINVTHTLEPGPNLYAKLEQLASRLNSQSVQGSEVHATQTPADSAVQQKPCLTITEDIYEGDFCKIGITKVAETAAGMDQSRETEAEQKGKEPKSE